MKGIHHIELSVLNYEESIKFYDQMFGWLGYKSFWTHNIGYLSTYYTAWVPFFHSYIGIQPAKSGEKLDPDAHATGVHHVALWARSRKQVDAFYHDFLLKNNIEVTEAPTEYPVYAPSYYAVFFNDPITGIHFELAATPFWSSLTKFFRWKRVLLDIWKKHPEWQGPPWKQMTRELPTKTLQKANKERE